MLCALNVRAKLLEENVVIINGLCFCLLLRMATNRILTPWVCETESNGVFFYIYTREMMMMMMMVSVLDFLGYICTLLLIGSSQWVIVKPIRYRPCMGHL